MSSKWRKRDEGDEGDKGDEGDEGDHLIMLKICSCLRRRLVVV